MPWLLIVLTVALTGAAVYGTTRLKNEDDVLVFLPEGDENVAVFKDVAKRFGALRVALIGVEPEGGRELFSKEVLGRMEKLTETLKTTDGVDRVLSLTNMTDLRPNEGGVDILPLLPSPLPDAPEELAKLKAHALSLPQVRGTFLSADGKASLLMVFLGEGAKIQPLAAKTRELVKAELGPVARLYFGGAPFAGQAIYDDTQRDVRKLTPLALVLFLGIVLLAFRDVLPVVLTTLTVAISVIVVIGGLGLSGEKFTVVSGTLPLILFASGSQYAIHVLGRYYLVRTENPTLSPLAAAVSALRIVGPPVAVAAINCCCGFLSFLVMNIGAMRSFGVACTAGVLVCLVLAITVLPSVVARFQRSAGKPHASFTSLGAIMEAVFQFARSQRILVITVSALIATVCAVGVLRVQVRMEPRAFFRPGSEPAEAQRFLDETFGGSQFVQILVSADFNDPRALTELRRLSAYARSLDGVTQVQSIIQPLSLVGEAMAGVRGMPPKRAQVASLYFFLEGEPSLRALLAADRKSAVVQVRLVGDARPILAALQEYLQPRWPFTMRAPTNEELIEELTWLVPKAERAARQSAIAAALTRIQKEGVALAPPPAPPAPPPAAAAGGDNPPPPEEPDPEALAQTQRLAAQRVASGLLLTALGTTQLGNRSDDEVRAALDAVAGTLLAPPSETSSGPIMTAALTGEPVLDQAFSRAVDRNQWASLGVALVSVLIVLLIAQRSLWNAILSTLPAVMSLLVVFGSLGLSGRPIDLGTSLVGSIVTSSGADFALHYIWYLRRRPTKEAVQAVGPVIFVTAALLGLGMGVLMLGGSPPLKLFGGLACAGLLLSATFTFLLVPALLGNTQLPSHPDSQD